jgi:hypothetical protein
MIRDRRVATALIFARAASNPPIPPPATYRLPTTKSTGSLKSGLLRAPVAHPWHGWALIEAQPAGWRLTAPVGVPELALPAARVPNHRNAVIFSATHQDLFACDQLGLSASLGVELR